MNSRHDRSSRAATVADEAARYLEAVELFASLGADPHTEARARAACARAREDRAARAPASARKAVLRWRT